MEPINSGTAAPPDTTALAVALLDARIALGHQDDLDLTEVDRLESVLDSRVEQMEALSREDLLALCRLVGDLADDLARSLVAATGDPQAARLVVQFGNGRGWT